MESAASLDITFIVGFILMGTFCIGQITFAIYFATAYKKLRNTIIAKGRLISILPILTLTNVAFPATLPQGQTMTQGIRVTQGAPPAYNNATMENKQYPPPYVP